MTSCGLLTLTELVEGLERDGMRYFVLDVFAWHVWQLREALGHGRLGELRRIDAEHTDRAWFEFQRKGTAYQIRVHSSGVAEVSRCSTEAPGFPDDRVVLGALDPEIVRQTDFPGMLLGLLVGERLGTTPDSARRILTMRFNEEENRWRAYDGPHAKWIRGEARKMMPALA